MSFKDVPIPKNMQHLKKDKRGYPIFHIVHIDGKGEPHFAVNDNVKRIMCLTHDRCSLCGKKLFRGRWFVGGPMSAFHPDGVYNDPPMHDECAHYALKVCPWLAAPIYSKSIHRVMERDGKYVKLQNGTVLIDETMIPERPQPFVAIMAVGQMYTKGTYSPFIKPNMPFRKIEYWLAGKQLGDEEGRKLTLDYLNRREESHGVELREISGGTPSGNGDVPQAGNAGNQD